MAITTLGGLGGKTINVQAEIQDLNSQLSVANSSNAAATNSDPAVDNAGQTSGALIPLGNQYDGYQDEQTNYIYEEDETSAAAANNSNTFAAAQAHANKRRSEGR